jgi:poly-beta-1,6-N-acetyl-D-glucosamine N-deacetylase
MPGHAAWSPSRVLPRGWAFRAVLALATLAIVLAPFAYSFHQAHLRRQVSQQVDTPPADLSEGQALRYAGSRARRTGPAAPIVVAYRDVRPSRPGQEPNPEVVTPATLASHLAMLAAAGYSTPSAEQLADYLGGGSLPPRSVVLTFDGGLQGTWVFADRLLRRYGFRGMVLVPTARIGDRTSRYLSWSELRRMHASRRWDVESQGPDPDATVPMTADGQLGGFYKVYAWVPGQRRRESTAERRRRVQAAVREATAALVGHELPAPRFFGGVATDPFSRQVIARSFRAVMDEDGMPSPVSRRDAASRRITRLPVRHATTAAQLFSQLASIAALRVTTRAPARDQQRWYRDWPSGAPRFGADSIAFASPTPGRLEALYAPAATEDWTDYAVDVEVAGLAHPATTAGLSVLEGSAGECEVRVSTAATSLFCPWQGLVYQRPLAGGPRHRLRARVTRQWLTVAVDGAAYRLRLPAAATGGFGLSIYRATGDLPAPRFDRLRLAPLPRGA